MRIQATLVFVALSALCAFAQDSKPAVTPPSSSIPAKKSEATDPDEHRKVLALWHERAEALTNAMLQEDEWRISAMRPVLTARLAQGWWKTDPARAHAWLADAVDIVTRDFPSDRPEMRSLRLRAAESVFRICEYLKQDEYAKKIVLALLDSAKKNGHDPARHRSPEIAGLAGSIMVAGTEIAREDPVRAADMASLLVQFHSGDALINILGFIRVKDPQDADRLYSRALDTALNSRDYTMMYSLMQYTFPYPRGVPPLPDALKTLTLEKVGALLSQPLSSDDDRQQFCMAGPGIASHLANNLPAAQQGIVQAAIQNCSEKAGEEQHGDPDMDTCDSSDTCLKLADSAKTDEGRAGLKVLAAYKARNDDPVRALGILGSLTPEEQESQPGWPNDYRIIGLDAIKRLYDLHDSHNIQRLIDDAPPSLRAQMALNLLDSPDLRKDKPYAISVLMESRRLLEKFPTDNGETYLQMCNFYRELAPEQAPQAFGFAVQQINQIHYPDPVEEAKKAQSQPNKPWFRWPKPGEDIQPAMIDGALVEQDEPYVTAAIKTIDDPEIRIGFRLAFLRYSLKKYEQELNKPPAAPKIRAAAAQSSGPK